MSHNEEEMRAKIQKRSFQINFLTCCSLIFEGSWNIVHGMLLPDVTLPPDFKIELASVDKRHDED
jgi:hypothetical protein